MQVSTSSNKDNPPRADESQHWINEQPMNDETSRITRVTTGNGDGGTTRLGNNAKVSKAHALVRALGSADELNSALGLMRCHLQNPELDEVAAELQQLLFEVGAVLAMAGEYQTPSIEAGLAMLTEQSEALNAALPPLREFVIPGGNLAAAHTHLCRTICRRAETDLWAAVETLREEHTDADPLLQLEQAGACLNRLSDYFFVLARTLMQGGVEQQWRGPTKTP